MKLADRTFKRTDWYITSKFGERIHPITKKKDYHYGLDIGTNCKNWPQYPLEDGIVVSVRTGKKSKDGSGYGNYVKIKYERLGIRVFAAHLKDVYVKLNQKVSADSPYGTTGDTGTATGIHEHMGLQTIKSDTWIDPAKYDYIPPIDKTKPVERNEEIDQLKVIKNKLRIRTTPSLKGNILGFAEFGFYNDLESKQADGYTWHKVADDNWLADVKGYVELLPKVELNVGDKVTFKELPDYFIISDLKDSTANITMTTDVKNLNKVG